LIDSDGLTKPIGVSRIGIGS